MTERSEKLKEAEAKISDELAKQASHEPGSAAAERAKEQRSRAEEELAKARPPERKHRK